MARKPSGEEKIDFAWERLKKAQTADELRAAQAVLFPLAFNMDLKQTAKAIGRSIGVTSTMRTHFGVSATLENPKKRSKRELRNRAFLTLEEERRVLGKSYEEFQAKESHGRSLPSVLELHRIVEKRLERTFARSTFYNMLKRHNLERGDLSGLAAMSLDEDKSNQTT